MEIPAITIPLFGDKFVLDFLPYFTVFGWKIYWYGVIIACGFLLAVWYTLRRTKQFGVTEDDMIDMLIWAVPLAIVGARLYFVIFYHDDDGVNPYFDGKQDLLDIVRIWQGGLAIYGGVIGGLLGCWIASRVKKLRFSTMSDLGVLGLLIGQSIGRWGNFVNREAHGGETTVAWRMGLRYSFKTFYYHPTFLYESLWNAVGFILLHLLSKKRKYDGQITLLYIVWYGLGRAIIEGLRTDSLFVGQSNLRVSQLLAILTCLAALSALLYVRVARHPEPEDLWVNRDRKAAMLAEEKALRLKKEEEEAARMLDEELGDAFRILTMKSGFDDRAEETVPEGPAVEPVDYQEAPEVSKAAAEEPEIPQDGSREEQLPEHWNAIGQNGAAKPEAEPESDPE